jgi:hypothetical protein
MQALRDSLFVLDLWVWTFQIHLCRYQPDRELIPCLIAKVLSRGLAKNISPLKWTFAMSQELEFRAGDPADAKCESTFFLTRQRTVKPQHKADC